MPLPVFMKKKKKNCFLVLLEHLFAKAVYQKYSAKKPETLLKRDSSTGVFLRILRNC